MGELAVNLDKLAAEQAQRMTNRAKRGINGVKNPMETLQRLVTKTLGVLQEQGIYAMVLFLHSRTNKDEEKVAKECVMPYLLEMLN
ncbi:MAG: hypothetical protein DRI61_14410, partial [Chloroflexi bacterium]